MSISQAPFLGLPIELLELVFDNILDPLDFCNASSTCKTFQSASSRLMKEHQALAEKFQTVVFSTLPEAGDVADADAVTNVWVVLDALLKDQRIRHHIRQVEFEAERQLFFDPSLDSDDPLSLAGALHPPAELLQAVATLDGSLSVDQTLLENGCDDPFNAILVRELPNLRTIKYKENGKVVDFYRSILGAATYTMESSWPPFLTNLLTVNLEHWDTEGGMGLEWLIQFMLLPSVRTINGHMIAAGEDLDWTDDLPKSNVTTLNLSYSCIELGALDKLLGHTQNLGSFLYEDGGAIVGDAECDPYGMVAVLLKHAGHSLETLRISYADDNDEDDVST